LKQKHILVAVASRTSAPDLGREMLQKLLIPHASEKPQRAIDVFDNLQIYPGSKTTHFERIHRDTGVDYEDMLFFDDESRNKNVETLGVVMWLVRDGVSRQAVDEGVKSWRKRNKKV
jgi:magnesium-dependent phosphatase 1